MPRKPRVEVSGSIYHVFARGNDRKALFTDTADRRTYLALLSRTTRRCGWLLLSYCLMPNHVHLLVETPTPNLAFGMHGLHSPYARAFNTRHGRTGHVFEKRYGAIRVETDAYLLTVVRYLANNPVEAGIAPTASAWRWSSHRAILGHEDPPAWLARERLLQLLSGVGAEPERTYGQLTEPKGAWHL